MIWGEKFRFFRKIGSCLNGFWAWFDELNTDFRHRVTILSDFFMEGLSRCSDPADFRSNSTFHGGKGRAVPDL